MFPALKTRLPHIPGYIARPIKVLLCVAALITAGVGVLNLPPVTRQLGEIVARAASERTGMKVACERAHFLLTGVRLTHLSVERDGKPAVYFGNLTIHPDLTRLLSGSLAIHSVNGDDFYVVIPWSRDQVSPSAGGKSGATRSALGSLREKAAQLLDPGGVTLTLGSGRVLLGSLKTPVLEVGISRVRVGWPRPGAFPVSAEVALRSRTGKGELTISTTTMGEEAETTMRVFGPGYPLEPLRAPLRALTPERYAERLDFLLQHVPTLPSVGGDFTVEYDGRTKVADLRGNALMDGAWLRDERLATEPLGPFRFSQDVSLRMYLDRMRLDIDRWDGKLNKAAYQVQGSVEAAPTGTVVSAVLSLNQAPYQDLLESVPSEATQALAGVQLGGSLDLRASLQGNLNVLDALHTDFSADWSRIRLEQPSAPLRGPEPLQGFVYVPYNKEGIRREFVLGRGQPGWVPLDQVPRYFINALLASEDINFYHHEGFDTEGLKKALQVNLKAGRAIRGGSTITQQLAKNLFLNRDKTAMRKLQEAVLAWELEQVFEKRQILELYLNVIEWGPGIYGIGRAAQHYFGKGASQLSIKEAAYLCTIIPNPIRYYMYFQRGELTERWNAHVQALLDRMRAFEYIGEEEYQLASEEFLSFRGSPRAAVDVQKLEEEDAAEEGEDYLELPLPPIPEGERPAPPVP